MSSIKEDELNMILDFANATPSAEQLEEYVLWKTVTRNNLLENIKGMNYDDRVREVYDYYATTLEFGASRKVTRHLDQRLLDQGKVYAHEFAHILCLMDTSENPSFSLWRESKLHQSHSDSLREINEYIGLVIYSRMPILADCQWIISAPEIKKKIMNGIPK